MKSAPVVSSASASGAPKSPVEKPSTGFYAPALDGLRCVAVFFVLIAHFAPTLYNRIEAGEWGVRLFFVLSGFLITRSLLLTRTDIGSGKHSAGSALKKFFIHRIFRLWPVYFLCLAIIYAFNVELTRESIWWHLGMVTNQYIFHRQSWIGVISPFWTLAVEQQFYVFWPFLILFVPKRWMTLLLLGFLVAGPMFRELIVGMRWTNLTTVYTPLGSCLDFFAIGGMIAWALSQNWLTKVFPTRIARVLIVLAIGWMIYGGLLKAYAPDMPRHWFVYDPLIQALGFGVLITYLLCKPQGLMARSLACRPLVYIGKISYGLYIFHNFMHWFGPRVLRNTIGISYPPNELLTFLYYSLSSIGVAMLSYHFFEEPIRRWGRRLA